MQKTNVMRILDQNKIEYKVHDYSNTNAISGVDVANVLNEDENLVYKTLVTIGKSNNYYVFLLPVNKELDLKKAALSVNEKSIDMVKSKELLQLTGYIHGGCSPIGMKKQFKTIIDNSILNNKTIYFSAGKIGYQIEINIKDLNKIIKFEVFNITI